MTLPKTVRGVNRGNSAEARYCGPAGVEPSATCRWDGTAPFCAGSCLPGETELTRSKSGDGALCLTGDKAFCCRL
jgi:hypothetical protein